MGEQPAHVGEHQVMDLGLIVDRRLNLGERVFQIPMLEGEGEGGPELLDRRRSLPFREPGVGLQGGGPGELARIAVGGRRPGEEPGPGALVGEETMAGEVAAAGGFQEVAEE